MFLISGPSLLYVFKKWSEFTLKVVRVYLKSGPSLPGPSLPGPSLPGPSSLVFYMSIDTLLCFLKYTQQTIYSALLELLRTLWNFTSQ